MKRKIAFIVLNNFNHDARVLKQSTFYASQGHEVEVYGLLDNKSKKKEFKNGVTINRVEMKSRKLPKKSIFQVIKYLEYMFRILNLRKFDYLFLSRAKSLPIGFFLKILSFNKVKLIYDSRELETESNGLHGIQKKLITIIEKVFIPMTDYVLAVSESIQKKYQQKTKNEVLLVTNSVYYQHQEKKRFFHQKFGINESKKIYLYQGRLTSGRGIELLVKAFKNPSLKDNVLVIMGHGELKDIIEKEASQTNNIFLHESVPQDVLLNYTSSADYAFCLIENTCLSYYYSLPNKLFEYSAAGLPLIVSDFPDMGRMVKKYDNGVLLNDFTVEGIIKSIDELKMKSYKDMVENSRLLAIETDWSKHETKLFNIIK